MADFKNPTIIITDETEDHTFTANGTFATPAGKRFGNITVYVPNGGTPLEGLDLLITENGDVYPPDNKRVTHIQTSVPTEQHTDEPVEFTENGVYTTPQNKRYDEITVAVPLPVDEEKTIINNGTYNAPDLVRWNKVIVNVPSGRSGDNLFTNLSNWQFVSGPDATFSNEYDPETGINSVQFYGHAYSERLIGVAMTQPGKDYKFSFSFGHDESLSYWGTKEYDYAFAARYLSIVTSDTDQLYTSAGGLAKTQNYVDSAGTEDYECTFTAQDHFTYFYIDFGYLEDLKTWNFEFFGLKVEEITEETT